MGRVLKYKKIRAGVKFIDAVLIKLFSKNFILFKGKKGFVMCGYLNLGAAKKFKDAAAKIVGASTIEQALKATVHSCTPEAKKIGIYKGQPIKETLKLIA